MNSLSYAERVVMKKMLLVANNEKTKSIRTITYVKTSGIYIRRNDDDLKSLSILNCSFMPGLFHVGSMD